MDGLQDEVTKLKDVGIGFKNRNRRPRYHFGSQPGIASKAGCLLIRCNIRK